MTLVNIVVILVVVGLVMWLINTYIPMAGAIKSLLHVVVFIVVLIWLLQTFGLIGNIPGLRIPPLERTGSVAFGFTPCSARSYDVERSISHPIAALTSASV